MLEDITLCILDRSEWFTSVLEDIQNLQFGNYTYDVIDQNGCGLNSPNINFRNVYIAEPPQITVSSNVVLIDCYGKY